MYRWKRKKLYRRIGMMLTVAGYLFFFSFLIDVEKVMLILQSPLMTYTTEDAKTMKDIVFELGMKTAMPLSAYAMNYHDDGLQFQTDDENIWASMDAQIKSEQEADKEANEEGSLQQGSKEDVSGNDVLKEKIEEENAKARESVSQNGIYDNTQGSLAAKTEGMISEGQNTENASADGMFANTEQPGAMNFIEHTKPVYQVDLKACESFDYLMKNFYVLDSTTYMSADELNVAVLNGQNLAIQKADNTDTLGQTDFSQTKNPQILIYHTHSQEGYADSIPGDDSTSVMGAGEELARILSQKYRFRVLHHMGKYDVKNRDYAYSEALPELEQILADNPTIEVVIDLHRDGVADETHLVTELDGKQTAQVMLFNGLSRTKKIGEIAYLKNEHRQSNLAFSFQLQKTMMEYYPGLARKIYLKGYRYNMHFKARSLLIELGAQTNTVEEVWNALGPLAHSIALVLEKEN